MDPNGHIYEDLEDRIPTEDKARLHGYLKGRAEADAPAREEAAKDALAAEVEALREKMRALEAERDAA